MKKTILTLYPLAFIAIGIWLFYLKTIYMGVYDIFNSWSICIIAGIVLVIMDYKKVGKTHRSMLVIFPIGIAIMLALIISEIPTITYKEAQKIIEEETGESLLIPPKNEIVGQFGLYYIYTEQGTYLVSSENGTFVKRDMIKSKEN
ncbi:hypothetical protein AEA09_09525 [Lysinibacillus contaminans]|uniref:Uncharacterized protein n=1 Tax=Lysinibacillus contaminans TaxID=1293441 RepID=A0ABR5K1V8_9BACI|nr:hypothetical protein [Lysinibacillus contaminans]KOS68753.1 hypothetical protein AEA09_09525 [Lysinibacillus contaminans]